MNTEKIVKEAKRIMDNFTSALKKSGKAKAEFKVKRTENIRKENVKVEIEKNFSERMFDNAPKKKDGWIIAEKKKF